MSLLPILLLTKLKRTTNVFDFGAIGDGVTDDSAAFSKALAFAAANGRVVTVPSLTYAIAKPIVFASVGNAVAAWGLNCEGATLVSKITDGSDVMTLISGHTVRYFRLTGGLTIKGSGKDGNGVRIFAPGGPSWFYNFLIDGLSVEGVGKAGLVVAGNSFEATIANSYFQDCLVDGAQFMNEAGGVLSTIHVNQCFFNQNKGCGLICGSNDPKMGGATDVRVTGGYIRQNGSFGAFFANGNLGAAMWGVGFENNCTALPCGDPNSAHVRSINDLTMYACQGGGNSTGQYLAWVYGVTRSVFNLCSMNTQFSSKLIRAEGQAGAIFLVQNSGDVPAIDVSAGVILTIAPGAPPPPHAIPSA